MDSAVWDSTVLKLIKCREKEEEPVDYIRRRLSQCKLIKEKIEEMIKLEQVDSQVAYYESLSQKLSE